MLARILQRLLSLRYRITVTGLEQITQTRGVLVLPNHPAEIDPVIVTTLLWDLLHPRPVVIEGMYRLPLLHSILTRIRAIPMADMDFESGPYKRRRIERSLAQILQSLEYGDNVLMYPSGRLSVTGAERIGGASGVHSILRGYPNAHVAVVKIRGLCGSIFSKATTGGAMPDVGRTCLRGIRILLQNLLLFTPRRPVSVEISFNPPGFPRDGDPLAINKYLEGYYNSPEPETPSLISHSCLFKKLPLLPEQTANNDSLDTVPAEVRDKVLARIAHVAQVPVATLTPETRLGDDLGIDSLTTAELLIWLDREFEVNDVELSELLTIGSLMRAATGQLSSSTPRAEFKVPASWTLGDQSRAHPELRSATTIAEAFLIACSRFGKEAAVGDPRVGVISWNTAKLKVVTLARYMARVPGTHVGILLPASVTGSIVTMAAILSGKTPVFLNWTAGKRSLLHACDTTGLHAIFTAESFLDILPTDLEFLEKRFVLLEQVVQEMSLKDKLAGKRLSRESTHQILEAFGQIGLNPDTPAVVLFTSGSEALPKGVPLTHRNIMSNVQGVLEAFSISRNDVLLGFLPPFHSFGLTICTLLPLMTGLKVAYHPNPNESRKIAKGIAMWGASIAAGTPTFLKSILKAGSADQFETLRALISGAERASDDLFSLASTISPAMQILEGYGITECSPVVSVGRPQEPRVGVGRPITGVNIAIVHPESLEAVPEGHQGLILIKGPSVFNGYLDPTLDPFIEYRKERWYNSGDLGIMQNGSLIITGRLKRFIKIAGEMVSLGAVEEALQKRVPSPDGAPSVAVLTQGNEGDGRPKLIAFVAGSLSIESSNAYLKEAGFPPLVHISEVRQMAALPVLGSGKTDYQSLKASLA
jgi:acyl-CoA synthetase (AMP-forming)/AMP-acid ligase II/1-acyl-sn-glycerol-3-phosphate acyltransferase/acyl carrier protein